MSRSVSAVSSADKRDAQSLLHHNNEDEFIVDNLNDGGTHYYDQRFSAGAGDNTVATGAADANKSESFHNILVDGSPYVGSPRGAHDGGIFALSGGSTGNTTGYEGRQEGSGGGAALGRGVNATSSTSATSRRPSTTTTYTSTRRLSSVERRDSVSATQLRVPVPHKTASVTWPDNKRVMLASASGASAGASVTSSPFAGSSSSAMHQRRNSSGVSRLPLGASGAGAAVVAGSSTTPPSTARRPSVSVSSAHNNGAPSIPRGRSLSVSSATHLQHNTTNNKQPFDLVPPTDASKLAALNVGEYELAKAGYAALPPPTDPRAEKFLRTRGIQNYARMHSNIERMQSEMQSFLEEQMRRAIEADPRIRSKQMKFKDKDGKPRAPTVEEERDLDRQQELLDELISNIYGVRQSSARFMRLFLSEEEKRHVGAKTHESFGKDTGDKDRSPPRRYNPFRHHVDFPISDDPAYSYANSPSKRNSLAATRRGTVRAGADSHSPQPRGGRTDSISTEFYNNHFNNNFRGFENEEGGDGGIAGGGGRSSSVHSSSAPNTKNGGGRGGAANHNASTSSSIGVNNNNNNNNDSSVSTNGRRGRGDKGEDEGGNPLFLDINGDVNGAGQQSSLSRDDTNSNAYMNSGQERRHMFSGGGGGRGRGGRAGGGGPDGQQATIDLIGDNAVMLNSHEAMVAANLNPEDVSVSAEESEEEEGEGGTRGKGRSSTPLQVPLLVGLTSNGDVEAPSDAFEENEHERERRQKKEQLRAEKEARKRERDTIRARREEEKRLRKLLEEQDAEALALAAAAAAEGGEGTEIEIELAPGKKVVVDPATAIALLMAKEEEDESEERRCIGREETFARRRLAEDEAEEAEHQRRQAATAAWKRRIAEEDATAAALAASEASERAMRRAKERAELDYKEQMEDLLLREKLLRRAVLAEEAETLAAIVSARAEHAEALRASAEEAAEASAAAALILLNQAKADKNKARDEVRTDDDDDTNDDEDHNDRDGNGRRGRRGRRRGGSNSSSDSDIMAAAPQPIVLLPSTTRTPALAPAKKTRAKTKTTYGICARSDGTVGGYDVSLRGSEAGEGSKDEGESGSAQQQSHTDPLVVAAVIKRIFGEDILISKDGEAEGISPVRRRSTKNGTTLTASTSRKGLIAAGRGGHGDNDAYDGEEATSDGGLVTVTRRKYHHPGGVPTPRSRSRSMPASLATTPRRQNDPTNSEGLIANNQQHHVRKGSNSALLPLSSTSPHKQNNNAVASSSSAKVGVPSSRLPLMMRAGGASLTAGSETSQTPHTAEGRGGGGILKHKKPSASVHEEDHEQKEDSKPAEINSGPVSGRKVDEGKEVVAILNPRNLQAVVGGSSSEAKPKGTPTSQTKKNNNNNAASSTIGKERRPTATTLSSLPLEKSLVSSSATAVASSQLVDDYLNSLPTSISLLSRQKRGAESDSGAWGITNIPASPPHIISGDTKGTTSASGFNAKGAGGGAKPSHRAYTNNEEEQQQQKEKRHNSSSVATAATNNNVSVNQMNSIRHRSTDGQQQQQQHMDVHEDTKENDYDSYNDDVDDDGFKSAISRSVSAGRSLGGTGRGGGGVHDGLDGEDDDGTSDRKVPEAVSAGRGVPHHHVAPTSSTALPNVDKANGSSTPNKTKRVLVKKKRLLSKSPPPGARRNSAGAHVDPALVH